MNLNPRCMMADRWLKRIVVIGWITAFAAVTSRADSATLRETGPRGGSLFSNIGVVAKPSPPSKITLATAEVKVHLRRGVGDQLVAECTADFVLEDRSDPQTGPQEFLVAFPVTGLQSKIVTVDNFSVEVDGMKPAMVFREPIVISWGRYGTKDTAVQGELEARFQVKTETDGWGVTLLNAKYAEAYVWVQKSVSGATTRVRVTYTATLRPQALRYAKTYARSEGRDVIPFADLGVSNWDDSYYLFDYVLMSGATWDGPIGKETIQFSADPELGLSLNRIWSGPRSHLGFPGHYLDPNLMRAGIYDFESEGNPPVWTIRGEPEFDALFAIPVSAIRGTEVATEK